MLGRRFSLGKYLGIGLYVHWTFALLLLYAAWMAREGGAVGMLFGILQLLAVFLCVTLHEYGHALAARRFGIPTLDITLLPIGGVARLERMPRIPWQELIVAVAGPAVNVVIAATLWTTFVLLGPTELADYLRGRFTEASVTYFNEEIYEYSLVAFGLFLLLINVVLVIFNMIPAFPMDGGRVFRSVMAMMIDYRKATTLASRVGLVFAVLMAAMGTYMNNPLPIVIALFIGYAGMAEARQVEVLESVRGLIVRDAMVRYPTSVFMDMQVPEIVHQWRMTSSMSIPVLGMGETVVGMLSLRKLATAIDDRVDLRTTAGELADHDVAVIHEASSLEDVIVSVGRQHRQIPVVDSFGHLSGILDLDTIMSRGALAQIKPSPVPLEETFDVVS